MRIERSRGYTQAALILTEQYAGVIGADGWAPKVLALARNN
jgi:hypothetical protein